MMRDNDSRGVDSRFSSKHYSVPIAGGSTTVSLDLVRSLPTFLRLSR